MQNSELVQKYEVIIKKAWDTQIINKEKGYLSAPWVNNEPDIRMFGFAADIITQWAKYIDLGITRVVPIPDSGSLLAALVAERLEVNPAVSRKVTSEITDVKEAGLGSWRYPILTRPIPSFTRGKEFRFAFNIPPMQTVLLIEDFIAHGNTAVGIIQELREHGMACHIASFCAKQFQGGVERIVRETGVVPFSLINFLSLDPELVVERSGVKDWH